MSKNLQALRSMTSLSSVSDAGVEWIAEHATRRQFDPGEELIRQGESARECYFIVDGETEVRREGTVLCVSGAGEPEGEVGLFLRVPRTATTIARTPVSTLVLDADHWDHLCAESPELADEIRVEICRHLARRFGLPAFAGVPVG